MLVGVDGGVGPLNKAPCVTGEDRGKAESGKGLLMDHYL